MRKFLKRALIFLVVPLIIIAICEIAVPVTFFVYRPWEAIIFSTPVPTNSPFYPNARMKMNSLGDLCHHTAHSILKKGNWIIDNLGYRNDEFIEEADILIIGDSFVAGSSLSQENTITSQVKQRNGQLKVYNMAPGSVSKFDMYLKKGIIKKPKLLIFSIVERNVPDKLVAYNANIKSRIKEMFEWRNVNIYIDKTFRLLSLNWLKARISNSTGSGIPGTEDSKMFFLNGKKQQHETGDLEATAEIIISYKKYCDSLGIHFLFLPMPDKETVYFENVPLSKQSNYLLELDTLLQLSNVPTINTLALYNEYKQLQPDLLYSLDDTHWNPTATELISKEIINKFHNITGQK